jgi:hypothetical protein
MTVITIYALYGDDLRLAFFRKPSDDIFFGLSALALFLFTVEFVVYNMGKPEYPFSFYFYLDLLAAISLIPDIGWLWDLLVGEGGGGLDGTGDEVRTGRAARAATRAGR